MSLWSTPARRLFLSTSPSCLRTTLDSARTFLRDHSTRVFICLLFQRSHLHRLFKCGRSVRSTHSASNTQIPPDGFVFPGLCVHSGSSRSVAWCLVAYLFSNDSQYHQLNSLSSETLAHWLACSACFCRSPPCCLPSSPSSLPLRAIISTLPQSGCAGCPSVRERGRCVSAQQRCV